MKATLFTMMLLAAPAWAETPALTSDVAKAIERMETSCGVLSPQAGLIMLARQLEVPMTRQLDTYSSDSKGDQMVREIIRAAYREPAQRTERERVRAADAFSNRIASECYDREAEAAAKAKG